MANVKTCLWFERDGEQAVRRYVELVEGSRIERVTRSPGPWPGGEAGDVIVVDFTLGGQAFQALNGGTRVDYGTAASISVECADQAEVDRLWSALTADGGKEIQCGWLRDRWGVPWQSFPTALPRFLAHEDRAVAARAFAAMSAMVKIDLAALERAAKRVMSPRIVRSILFGAVVALAGCVGVAAPQVIIAPAVETPPEAAPGAPRTRSAPDEGMQCAALLEALDRARSVLAAMSWSEPEALDRDAARLVALARELQGMRLTSSDLRAEARAYRQALRAIAAAEKDLALAEREHDRFDLMVGEEALFRGCGQEQAMRRRVERSCRGSRAARMLVDGDTPVGK